MKEQKFVDINREIKNLTKKHIGQEEIRGNKGFKDKEFEKRMKVVGWESGQAWCAYFCELMWRQAYRPFIKVYDKKLAKLFSASAVQTFDRFDESDRWVTNREPVIGAVVIWQHFDDGMPDWRGHAGIAISYLNDKGTFYSIEGNTNKSGGREGYVVVKKRHNISELEKENGLVLKGFIYPRQVFKNKLGKYKTQIS